MKNLVKLAFATLLLASCSREDDLIGTYEADRYHFLEMAPMSLFQKTGFAAGSTLELKEDSSFLFLTCGSKMEGNWSVKEDSLILDIDSSQWRINSLQEHGYFGRWPKSFYSKAFSIEGDHLINLYKRNPDVEGDYRVFTRLKKIED